MAFDRQAALDAGYTEQEIDAYLQNQPEAPPPPASAASGAEMEPPAPTTQVTPAGEGNYMPAIATTGLAAAGAAVPAAIGYGVAKFGGRAMDLAKNVIGGGGSSATRIPTTMPVNPAAINPSGVYAGQGTGPAPTPQQPGAIRQGLQQGMEYANKVRQIAMEKVMQTAQRAAPVAQAARPFAPAAVGLGSLFYSGGLNQGEDEELRRRQAMPPTIR